MKILKKVFLITGILFLMFLVTKNFLIKTAIVKIGSTALGAPVKIDKFSLGVLTQKVSMKGVRIYNPPGFGDDELIDIPEITVKYDLMPMLSGKVHVPLAVINLKKMVVVRNKEGQLNVDALKVIQDSQKPAKEEKIPESESEPGLPEEKRPAVKKPVLPPLQIDSLKLNIGQVVFKDFSKGDIPTILVYEIDLKNKEFKDINGIPELITVVLINAMGPTAIKSAGIYAAGALMGVGFLPAGVFGVIVGKDNATAEIDIKYKKIFEIVLNLLKEIGDIKKIDHERKAISAKVQAHDVKVWFKEISSRKTKLNVTARKFLLPDSKFAGGILYQIKERVE